MNVAKIAKLLYIQLERKFVICGDKLHEMTLKSKRKRQRGRRRKKKNNRHKTNKRKTLNQNHQAQKTF